MGLKGRNGLKEGLHVRAQEYEEPKKGLRAREGGMTSTEKSNK